MKRSQLIVLAISLFIIISSLKAAILSSSWDTNSSIEPDYTTDSQSAIVTDYNTWENVTLIQ